MPKQVKHKVFLGSGLARPGLAWTGLVWVEQHQQQYSYPFYDHYHHQYHHQYHHNHDCQNTHHQHKYLTVHPYLQYEGDQHLIDGV